MSLNDSLSQQYNELLEFSTEPLTLEAPEEIPNTRYYEPESDLETLSNAVVTFNPTQVSEILKDCETSFESHSPLEELQREVLSLRKKLTRVRGERETLKATVEELHSHSQQYIGQLEKENLELKEELRQTFEAFENEKRKKRREKKKSRKYQGLYEEFRKLVNESNEKEGMLQGKLTQLHTELISAQREIERLQNNTERYNKGIATLTEQTKAKDLAYEELLKHTEYLSSELSRKENKRDSIQAQVEELKLSLARRLFLQHKHIAK